MPDQVEVTLKPDEVIPGQEYCLVSFISPENVLKNKDVFFFQQFINQFEVNFTKTEFGGHEKLYKNRQRR